MNHLLDDDPELMPRRDREVTLSTGSILGIFFGAVLVCGLFFAFGYNMGHKASATTPPTPEAGAETSVALAGHAKPSAGSLAGNPSLSTATTRTAGETTPVAPATPQAAPAPGVDEPTPTPITRVPPPAATAAHPAAAPAAPASGGGNFIVQIAAVSHQEDAELLVGALRSKGYTVSARTEPQDKLFHIQVGPFGNKKDADAMRQRLLGDGYNAIVK